jgi:hypothetical protein
MKFLQDMLELVMEKLWQNLQPNITDDDDATNRRNKMKIFTNPDMGTNENFQFIVNVNFGFIVV